MQKEITKKEWLRIVDKIDELFVKGQNNQRGKAIVLVAQIFVILGIKVSEQVNIKE